MHNIYEFSNNGLVPFPKTWTELEQWFNKINKDIPSVDLMALIKRIKKDDIICKNRVKDFLAKENLLPKKDFDTIWKQYEISLKNKDKPKKENDTLKRQEEEIEEEILNEFDIKVLDDTKQILIRENVGYFYELQKFDITLKNKIEKIDKGSYRSIKNDIIAMIQDNQKTRILRKDFCTDDHIIPFKNGICDFRKNCFIPKEKIENMIFFYEIPYEYKNDKVYDCQKFKKLLTQWIYKKIKFKENTLYIPKILLIRDIFEAMGLSMTMNTGFKKHFIPFGETDSGKTQFGNIKNNLFDTRNVAGTTLQRIGKNEFGLDNLQFMIHLTVDDLPYGIIYETGTVKDLLGGGNLIQGELKGGKKFLFTSYIKAWFNANKPPKLKDPNDDAFFNRFIFLPFLNRYEQGKKDYILNIWKQIVNDPEEMQGIIHECLKGYNRLLKRGRFRKRLSKNTRHIWLYYSDPLYKFLFDYTEKDKSYHGTITAEEFKEKFAVEMLVSYSPQELYKRLSKYGIVKYKGDKVQMIRGIKWKENIKKKEIKKPEEVQKKIIEFDKQDINKVILKIREIYEENDYKFLFKSNIVSVLNLDFKKELIEQAFKEMHEQKMFIKSPKGLKLKIK